jgi:hypothetical protein
MTVYSLGTNVCWQVYLINPKSNSSVGIQSIGNSNAWGSSGQPERAPYNSQAFTGTVQNAGHANYPLAINVQVADGSGVTVNLQPSVAVNSN